MTTFSSNALLRPEKGIDKNFMQALEKELQKKGLALGDRVFVRALRNTKTMEVWMQPQTGGAYIKAYDFKIQKDSGGLTGTVDKKRYPDGLGPKMHEGDLQAVEGFYSLKTQPHSDYHLAAAINYPNAYDRAKGHTGSAVKIHGTGASIGCFAIGDIPDPRLKEGEQGHRADKNPRNNMQMSKLFTLIKAAELKRPHEQTPLHSFPFAMTKANLAKYGKHTPHFRAFWSNLAEGYNAFEKTKFPPNVMVGNNAREVVYAFPPTLIKEPTLAKPPNKQMVLGQ